MRILFAGSPEIALPSLALLASRGELIGVLAGADVRKGRGMRPSPQPVALAAARDFPLIPVLKPERLDSSLRAKVAALEPDFIVVFAYGKIFGPKFLSLFPKGGLNIHPSLLPRYRGCAPIPAAILAREPETGVSVQTLALEMDTGDILAQARIPLSGRETTGSLSAIASRVGAELLGETLDLIAHGVEKPIPQDHAKASYCSALKKEDGLLDWGQSSTEIDARIRAFDPWPGCFTSFKGARLNLAAAEPYGGAGAVSRGKPGEVVGVDKARGILVQTGEGLISLVRLQFAAKKAMDFKDFLNGTRDFVGAVLGEDGMECRDTR